MHKKAYKRITKTPIVDPANPMKILGRKGTYTVVLQTLCRTGCPYGNQWLKTRDSWLTSNTDRTVTKSGPDVWPYVSNGLARCQLSQNNREGDIAVGMKSVAEPVE